MSKITTFKDPAINREKVGDMTSTLHQRWFPRRVLQACRAALERKHKRCWKSTVRLLFLA